MPLYNTSITNVDLNETRRYAGLIRCPEFSDVLLKQACTEAQLYAQPKGSWHIYEYCPDTATISAPKPLTLAGNSIKKHLVKSSRVAIMAVTIGLTIEDVISQKFAEGNYTAGLLLDAAATTAVEQAADQLNNIITYQANQQGYQTVSRFSPGYGDWDITVQADIAELGGASDIGITVTDTSMLIPRKSVTAIIGFVPHQGGEPMPLNPHTGCSACTHTTCRMRQS